MLNIKENELLAKHTTYKIGGPAKFFIEVDDAEKMREAIAWAKENGEKIFILGWGSNVLASDSGFDGVIIKLSGGKIDFAGERATAFAGADLGVLARRAAERRLSGLEFAANIPGSVGGAVRGNAGAYGKGIGDFVEKVIALDIETLKMKKIDAADCEFSYRDSLFKRKDDIIIVEVTLKLVASEKSAEELLTEIDDEKADRKAKQPLEYPSAGCVFTNIEADKLSEKKRAELAALITNGKIAAGCLIERSGLKGKKIGGAQISEKHANFIVNVGGAKAVDVSDLIKEVKRVVREKFDVGLREEIQYL